MRLLIAMTLAALVSTNSFGQDHPLEKLTVTSTRLKCSSGFAEVTYGYRRGLSEAAETKLEFVVIETNKRTEFHLNNKVDDVTPPAYIAMAGSEHTVDLPNKNQLHELSGRRGRYHQADSDVTLGEIRAWLDQPDLVATIEALLAFKSQKRAESLSRIGPAHEDVSQVARWVPTRPQKIVLDHDGTTRTLNDNSIEVDGDTRAQELTLYFEFQRPTQIQRIRIELLPRTVPVDPARPRQRKRLVLFDVKPFLENSTGQTASLNFSSCVYLDNPEDESTANLIDYLTDTGWTVPPFSRRVSSHQLVFGFAQPVNVDSDHRMVLTLDSGGSPELDVLTRLRVSFVAKRDN